MFLGNLMTCDLTDTLQVQLVKAQWWDLPLLTEAELVHFGFAEFMTNPCQKYPKMNMNPSTKSNDHQ